MALTNKERIETEYAAKATAVRAIAASAVEAKLEVIASFMEECQETVRLLEAREALNGRPLQGDAIGAARAALANLESALRQLRAGVPVLQAALPE